MDIATHGLKTWVQSAALTLTHFLAGKENDRNTGEVIGLCFKVVQPCDGFHAVREV